MKRNWDLVRAILLELEGLDTGGTRQHFHVAGYDDLQVGYHVLIMKEAGLVEAEEITTDLNNPMATPFRLTWLGHEFIEASKEPSTWEKCKNLAEKAGLFTLDVAKGILVALAKDALSK